MSDSNQNVIVQPTVTVKKVYTSSYIKKNGEVRIYQKEYIPKGDGKRGRRINEIVQKKKEINELLKNITSMQHFDDIIYFIKNDIQTN